MFCIQCPTVDCCCEKIVWLRDWGAVETMETRDTGDQWPSPEYTDTITGVSTTICNMSPILQTYATLDMYHNTTLDCTKIQSLRKDEALACKAILCRLRNFFYFQTNIFTPFTAISAIFWLCIPEEERTFHNFFKYLKIWQKTF